MARKVKKERQIPCNEEANRTKPWPDLPEQLVKLIGRESTLMQNISFGGVSKSWRAAPKQCNPTKSPWLQLSGADHDQCRTKNLHIFSISFPREWYWYWYRRKRPQYTLEHYVGCSHGQLVVVGPTPADCYLHNPVTNSIRGLPPWDASVPFRHAVLSSSPEDPRTKRCVVLVLTGTCHPAFVFYKLRDEYAWKKQDCTLADRHSPNQSQQSMQFTNAIGFQGKFYALSLQGTLAVIEDIDSRPRVTTLGTRRAVPSTWSRHFREYLVVSGGEILLLFLIYRKSISIVDDVEVFRLHLSKLTWVKMENLGDRTLFAGANCCMSVSASKVGCRSNCIYFTHHTVDGWWVYDLERGGISPGWSSNNSAKSRVWIEPISEE